MSAITEIAKFAGSAALSVGVGGIVGNIVKATTPEGIKLYRKVAITGGSLILSSMVSDKAEEYIANRYNDAKAKLAEAKNKANEVVEESDTVADIVHGGKDD